MRMKIRNKEAQSAAIGAVLTMIIITLILTIIYTTYVPAWIEEKESNHMKSVKKSFLDLKSNIDSLILKENTDLEYTTSITLGNEGIPILAVGTLGTIEIKPYEHTFSLYNATRVLNITSEGYIKFTSQNREYTPQNYIYEFGAVIIDQSKNDTMISQPTITVTNNSGSVSVSIVMVSLWGDTDGLTGMSTCSIKTKLKFYNTAIYDFVETGGSDTIVINITTDYPSVWERYLNSLSSTLGSGGSSTNTGEDYIEMEIYNVDTLTVYYASISAEIEYI